ncbi:hypothetical protein K443DRAFT_677018 [Laccaria amethystina LaAM-08-1]|uniref:Uncharacterized protein n=1 Tax=Laccaria amethystina LaAM-08-1 TaxID=1095629 RepID=A0A0C9Y517_9AGAR|nr:hypothetical protein K443DRAFT_677018 [Laccaria amethystina LaAM-08-1]
MKVASLDKAPAYFSHSESLMHLYSVSNVTASPHCPHTLSLPSPGKLGKSIKTLSESYQQSSYLYALKPHISESQLLN